jgi:hypothetical protein
MNVKKSKTAPKPKRPAPNPPVKKAMKIEIAPEPEIRDVNPPMPEDLINKLFECFHSMRSIVENHAARLNALDRRRLNGVRKPTLGFVVDAYKYAEEYQELLPYYCPIEKFREDFKYFENFQSLFILGKQLQDMLWNISLKAADTVYEDALIFYAQVREANLKGIGAHEDMYNKLFQFFKKNKRAGAGPTQKEVRSDMNALLSGKREGEVIVRNVKPKVIRGSREVVDKKYEGGERLKEEITTNEE